MAKMAASDVLDLLDWIQAHNIEVWLNGGWGIDALLGHQTREHDDLDLTISATDSQAYTDAMAKLGFTTSRIDNDFNWVLVDERERVVDVHLVDFGETMVTDKGVRIYGPRGLPFEVGSLQGSGDISGKRVKCETAEFQVRGHTRYQPDEQDYQDVLALCKAFSIQMPDLLRSRGFIT